MLNITTNRTDRTEKKEKINFVLFYDMINPILIMNIHRKCVFFSIQKRIKNTLFPLGIINFELHSVLQHNRRQKLFNLKSNYYVMKMCQKKFIVSMVVCFNNENSVECARGGLFQSPGAVKSTTMLMYGKKKINSKHL
jgi:hypothetical protein